MHATASIPMEVYSSHLAAPAACDDSVFAEELDRAYEANLRDGSPVKGLLAGLCLEAAAVFFFWGLWRVWHFIL